MTTLDDRARAAAEDLRRRAERRPVAAIESFGQPPSVRRHMWVPVAAVVLVVAAVVALAVSARDADDRTDVVTSPEPPSGVEPVTWAPEELGVSLQVPQQWTEEGAVSGFAHSIRGDESDAYVLATLVFDHTERDVEAFAEARRAVLDGDLDVSIGSVDPAMVDGRDAVVWDWQLQAPAGGVSVLLTEYIIDVGDKAYLLVDIGAPADTPHAALRRWIGSTLRVTEPHIDLPTTEHPDPTEAPAGIAPVTWSPEDLGVSIDVPRSWTEGVAFEHGLSHAISSGGQGAAGATPYVLAERMPRAFGSPTSRAAARERDGSQAEAKTETTVDGQPATITRYRFPVDEATAAIQVEYVIDLGDETFAVLTFGYPPAAPTATTDWIRSTIGIND